MATRTRPWFYYFSNAALRLIFRIILRLDVRGLENVPRDGPLIIAISHSSFLDPLLAGAYTPRDVTPMAKSEAFGLPVIGWIVRAYGAFPVRRGEVDIGAFKTALQILSAGGAMVIAPEGHRSESGDLQKGREGAIMLSLRSGAPILPVAVWGGKAIWKNLSRLRRTEMKLYVGEPIIPAAIGAKPTRERMADMAHELMVRIASMMPPEVRGYYSDLSQFKTQHMQPYRPAEINAAAGAKQKEAAIR
ncbi:MAG: 1-acyl-sn-glycerol-3-phosphate acyltransferase [Chloroflexi bacterium]|nr:1-acyl-sn-glycerol-3-phosphate acyltransferase [Chloroflexota bacterium]